MLKQIVDIHPQEGISNRIIKLILALYHTADLKYPVYYNWRKNDSSVVKKAFHDLFRLEYCKCNLIEIDLDYNEADIWSSEYINGGEYRNLAKFYGACIFDIRNGIVIEWDEYSKNSIDKGFIYDAPKNLLNHYLPFFNSLKPSEKVEKKIKEIKNKNYISVHVRLDDVWKKWGRGSNKDLKMYFEKMKQYPDDTLFFLASCDKNIAQKFKKVFGGGVLLKYL